MYDTNYSLVLSSAVRYALGRRTYITSVVSEYFIDNIDKVDTSTLLVTVRDIDNAPSLGDDNIDKPNWVKLREEIMKELTKRQYNVK